MTTRMKWLVGILVAVVIGAALYFSIVLSPPTPEGFNFFGGATSTATLPQAGTAPTKQPASTPVKHASGYTVTMQGQYEVVTSPAAGISLVAPVNSSISQANSVLTVTPPQSKSGESLVFRKTAGGYPDAVPLVLATLNGTQNAFEALHNAADSSEFNPGNVVSPAHITKIKNLTIGDSAAVEVRIVQGTVGTAGARDIYVIWVRSGADNWFIERTSAGLTPGAASTLDTMLLSIALVR